MCFLLCNHRRLIKSYRTKKKKRLWSNRTEERERRGKQAKSCSYTMTNLQVFFLGWKEEGWKEKRWDERGVWYVSLRTAAMTITPGWGSCLRSVPVLMLTSPVPPLAALRKTPHTNTAEALKQDRRSLLKKMHQWQPMIKVKYSFSLSFSVLLFGSNDLFWFIFRFALHLFSLAFSHKLTTAQSPRFLHIIFFRPFLSHHPPFSARATASRSFIPQWASKLIK